MPDIQALEDTNENNILIESFYNASHIMNDRLMTKFKYNDTNPFDLIEEYRTVINSQRDSLITKFKDEHKDIQVKLE